MKGRLIVLEGIDGCGKSTQIQHLKNWLPKSGLMPQEAQLHLTREPGGTELGNSLRDLLLDKKMKPCPTPITELLLYAADRAQHISELISPALAKGDWVISDRFSGSTLAYQGYGRGLDIETIKILELIACQGIVPDITFWLDISLEESLSRRSWLENDRIEKEGKVFLNKVAIGFAQIAKEKHWKQIDANKNINSISKSIEEYLIESLQSHES